MNETKTVNKSILNLAKKMFSEKSSNFSDEEGEIHPIYEAVAKLIIDQVSDEDARRRLIDADRKVLKAILITDGFLEYLKTENQKNEIRNMLNSGKSLEEIIDRAAIYLSENKRTRDGTVLYQINSLPQKTQKDFYEKIKKINSNQIYISKGVLDYLKTNEKEFRKNRIIKYSIIAALISGFLIGSYFFKKNYDIKIEKQTKAVYEYIDTISPNRNF